VLLLRNFWVSGAKSPDGPTEADLGLSPAAQRGPSKSAAGFGPRASVAPGGSHTHKALQVAGNKTDLRGRTYRLTDVQHKVVPP